MTKGLKGFFLGSSPSPLKIVSSKFHDWHNLDICHFHSWHTLIGELCPNKWPNDWHNDFDFNFWKDENLPGSLVEIKRRPIYRVAAKQFWHYYPSNRFKKNSRTSNIVPNTEALGGGKVIPWNFIIIGHLVCLFIYMLMKQEKNKILFLHDFSLKMWAERKMDGI